MPADLTVANHLRIAAQDLAGARTLAAAGNRNAIYLCQQAAEKVAKAVLESEGIQSGREHRNDVLAGMVPPENPFKPVLTGLSALTPYATTYRYPKAAGRIPQEPPVQALMEMVSGTSKALEEAARLFGVNLAADDTVPALDASPIRPNRTPTPPPASGRRR